MKQIWQGRIMANLSKSGISYYNDGLSEASSSGGGWWGCGGTQRSHTCLSRNYHFRYLIAVKISSRLLAVVVTGLP